MNILNKISEREKKFLLTGGVIIILILLYQFLTWYKDVRALINEHVETKQIALQKQLDKISGEKAVKERLEKSKAELHMLEAGLLSGDKMPVAAAEIQRQLKGMAVSLGIEIKLEKTLDAINTGTYIEIPVEIGFVSTTSKLKDMLYNIKSSPLLLTVPKMKIHVTNMTNPSDIYTTLVVKGFMKKPETGADAGKEGKNAA